MFSLTHGRPIAKSDGKNKIILSIIDPDEEEEETSFQPIHKGGKCGGIHRCCKYCDDELCLDDPCCNNCEIYYEADCSASQEGGSMTDSEEDYYEDVRNHKQDVRNRKQGLQMTKYNVPAGSKLIPLPDLTQRDVGYIAGPSGVGKSHIAGALGMEFKKVFPKKPVYIFSRTDAKNDPAYSKLKPIQINIDESLLEDPIDITEEITEGGALMIFDDCGTIQNDKLKKEVEKLMSDAMEVGRKLNCSMLITNHLVIPNEKKFARTVLNEMNSITVFPKSGSSQQIRYALKTYIGLNNKQIDEILALKSRWVRISKNYPQHVLYDKGAYIL